VTTLPGKDGSCAVRVVKVGGSLLLRKELPSALQAWVTTQPAGHTVLICGGGDLVETIRVADRVHGLGEVVAHWLAIAAMDINAQLLAALLPWAVLVESWGELQKYVRSPGISIFAVESFLRWNEPNMAGTKLVEHWDVTSDAISARVAIGLPAHELVLLKSAPPGELDASLSQLSERGYIDRFLPKLHGELPPVRFECLLKRDDGAI